MSKIITQIARFFSALFSPLLCGTYAVMLSMWLSFLIYSPVRAKLIVLLVTFIATCVLPVLVIFLLWKLGVVGDPALNNRRDRRVPYCVAVAGYVGVAIYLTMVHAPAWLSMLVAGGALSLVVLSVVNIWWKMSGHATAVGGLCAVVLFMLLGGLGYADLRTEFLCAVLVAGLVCTSRLVLGRHTLGQVAAGFVTGLVCTMALPMLFD